MQIKSDLRIYVDVAAPQRHFSFVDHEATTPDVGKVCSATTLADVAFAPALAEWVAAEHLTAYNDDLPKLPDWFAMLRADALRLSVPIAADAVVGGRTAARASLLSLTRRPPGFVPPEVRATVTRLLRQARVEHDDVVLFDAVDEWLSSADVIPTGAGLQNLAQLPTPDDAADHALRWACRALLRGQAGLKREAEQAWLMAAVGWSRHGDAHLAETCRAIVRSATLKIDHRQASVRPAAATAPSTLADEVVPRRIELVFDGHAVGAVVVYSVGTYLVVEPDREEPAQDVMLAGFDLQDGVTLAGDVASLRPDDLEDFLTVRTQ
jgi:hypothetical protein